MPQRLSGAPSVSGCKQVRRAVAQGCAVLVYLACDADPGLTKPLRALCESKGVAVCESLTMRALGRQVGIAVGTAAAAMLAR